MLSLSCAKNKLFASQVKVGLDRVFELNFSKDLQHKKVGLITNSASCNAEGESALSLFIRNQKPFLYELKALFAPEHGLKADLDAFAVVHDEWIQDLPVYSLHGSTKRPTTQMLKDLDILIFDLQTVGTRCYTYETTLFYTMEEAAKTGIELWVLDRPNPIGGEQIDGQLLEERYKCFFGYLEIPFLHAMTIGELALYFKANKELPLSLKIIPMKGWARDMLFEETHLKWKATSPNIPDAETTLVYPATVVLGETLEIVNIDKAGDHPFKRLGAPWINAEEFARALNSKHCLGVYFEPHAFTPLKGSYKHENCQGIFLKIVDPKKFKALDVQKALSLTLIELYPQDFYKALDRARKMGRQKACHYLTGNTAFFSALEEPHLFDEKMKIRDKKRLKDFLILRQKCLLY